MNEFYELKIDGYNVEAEFLPSDETIPRLEEFNDDDWYMKHVRKSQYLLQVEL